MKQSIFKAVVMTAVGVVFALAGTLSASAATPKKGGILNFVVGSKIPSYDGHIESTFGMIHPIRPFLQFAVPGQSGQPGRSNRLSVRCLRRQHTDRCKRRDRVHFQHSKGPPIPQWRTTECARCQGDLRQDHLSA